jgi:HAD superfamily hydrolase (TIGR01549 family)
MIRAMIFDLDGTLVQTERLKAMSYAWAVKELCPVPVDEAEVLEAFKQVVGLSRREVALNLVERFGLEEKARARIQVRLRYYEDMLEDPQVLRTYKWEHNMALLDEAQRANCKVGLATMSHCQQVQRVLKILDLSWAFDFIATRDDVSLGKPDPEIYSLVSMELGIPAEECLVVEDSPAGVKAALAAGMRCVAVSTPFTRERLHTSGLLGECWIVDDPARLPEVVREAMQVK